MAQKPDGKSGRTERLAFTRKSVERIQRVVRIVEAGDRKSEPLRFGTRAAAGSGAVVKFGAFLGDWPLGEYNAVTMVGSTVTASVLNACNPVLAASDTNCARVVLFSNVKGTQVALELQYEATCTTCHISINGFDLTTLPGYENDKIQILGHDSSACLTWYSTNTCV